MKLSNIPWTRIAAASALMISAAAVQAVPLKFVISGAYTATWIMDSNPVPDDYGLGSGFVLYDTPGTFSGAATSVVDIFFYSSDNDGGLEIVDFNGSGDSLAVTDGPQIYTGLESAPVFHTGTFAMTEYGGTASYLLTVSSVPEPATVVSMLAGLGLVGAALRRRKVKASIAA